MSSASRSESVATNASMSWLDRSPAPREPRIAWAACAALADLVLGLPEHRLEGVLVRAAGLGRHLGLLASARSHIRSVRPDCKSFLSNVGAPMARPRVGATRAQPMPGSGRKPSRA